MKSIVAPVRIQALGALIAGALAMAVGCDGQALPMSALQAQTAAPSGIELPEILAIELPASGMTSIAPSASPAKELLESASAIGFAVTHDVRFSLPLGASQVTWTAWRGAPGTGQAVATRQAWVYVFPFGQTPAGISGRHDATAGNHSAKVVRDRSGRVHVAWLDAARPGKGTTVLYRSGVQDPATGRFTWDTPVSRLSALGAAVGMVSMEMSPNALHFAWSTESTTRYLRVLWVGDQWRSDPIRDTRAAGGAYDNGSDLAVRGDDEIHVLTYTGQYAASTDGGSSWRVEKVPWPPGEKKNPALAVDPMGNAHVVFTLKVRVPTEWKSGQPNGAYWQLRYVRRQAEGGWVDGQDMLGAFPEWRDRGMSRDVVADWPDIAADAQGNLHVAFHGTANSGKYGQDEAFYVRRTQIVDEAAEIQLEDLIVDEQVVVTVSHSGYLKRTPTTIYRSQRRGGQGRTGMKTREEDFVEHLFIASTHAFLLIFTNTGRVYWLKVYEVPDVGAAGKGKHIGNLVALQPGESVRTIVPVRDLEEEGKHIFFATRTGTVKKTALKDFSNVMSRGIIAIGIDKDDELVAAAVTDGFQIIFLASHEGMAIRFGEEDVRPMGRPAYGVRGMDMDKGDYIVGMAVTPKSEARVDGGKKNGKDEET